jgi:transposase
MKLQSDATSQPISLPVEIVSPGTPMAAAPAPTSRGNSAPGTIEIELAGSRVRVRGAMDEASLRSVLAALRV